MTRQVDDTVESPTLNRRHTLLPGNVHTGRDDKENNDNGNGSRIGEVAGGTAAECAAVCCCCPCALMHLIVLAVYRVPAGLCRKAIRKHKRKKLLRRRKNDLLSDENSRKRMNGHDAVAYGFDHHHGDESDGGDDNPKGAAVDLDSEMWDRFYGAGFWRSYSRREE
ncbi:OLC1v1004885C1 [Oldenlandia corymbosa var. corymbosa]|uniref:OLC1v1004885C1 n=1 Tax=Oldenlandia corymbosa var. corymbosa TaxID=529605 RepID=A0AAV1DGU0_OLDCO|nr:OLC1v1004885C1 [Oldenlandia corymbosa var. corymbosa]